MQQFLEQYKNILKVKLTGAQLTRAESGSIIDDGDLWLAMRAGSCMEWNGKIVNFGKGEAVSDSFLQL